MQSQPKTTASSVKFEVREVGRVLSVKQFIVVASGLPSCINGQMVEFEKGMKGFVMGFSGDKTQILVLGSPKGIRSGDEIYNRGESFTLPTGKAFMGRVVNALCEPQDGIGPIIPDEQRYVFQEAPALLDREQLSETMETGTLALDAGIPRTRIVLDPGFGFGKTVDHNMQLLHHFDSFARLGQPLMAGVSRKSFIGHLTGAPVEERLAGSLAAAAVAIERGAHILRVHDVAAHRQLSAITDHV